MKISPGVFTADHEFDSPGMKAYQAMTDEEMRPYSGKHIAFLDGQLTAYEDNLAALFDQLRNICKGYPTCPEVFIGKISPDGKREDLEAITRIPISASYVK